MLSHLREGYMERDSENMAIIEVISQRKVRTLKYFGCLAGKNTLFLALAQDLPPTLPLSPPPPSLTHPPHPPSPSSPPRCPPHKSLSALMRCLCPRNPLPLRLLTFPAALPLILPQSSGCAAPPPCYCLASRTGCTPPTRPGFFSRGNGLARP